VKIKYKWFALIIAFSIIIFVLAIKLPFQKSAIINGQIELKELHARAPENLQAFAKLYGYIKYFHPSDEASEFDWESFSIYGVQQVVNAKNSNDLKNKLEELFAPIAPTLQIYSSKEKAKEIVKEDGTNLIAWQHFGLGLGSFPNSGYESKRVISDSRDEIKLFNKTLSAGASVNKSLSSELNVQIPIVLYNTEKGTLGDTKESQKKYKKLNKTLSDIKYDEKTKFIANTILTWNVLQHFYPYFDVVDVNWESELDKTLTTILKSSDRSEYERNFKFMLAALGDGHISALAPQNNNFLPFNMEWIENELIITTSESADFQIGDRILSINGVQTKEFVAQVEREISGSNQWKKYKALKNITYANSMDSSITLSLNRNGNILEDVSVTYDGYLLDEFNRSNIEPLYEIEEGIYYVNQTQLTNYQFEENIEKLSTAKGIIFDLRGYPEDWDLAINIISHLTDKTVQSPYIQVPKIIYPDQEKIDFESVQWPIEPISPKFTGRIVYLTYSGAISRSELFLDIVKHYKLGEVVGQRTAGANGGHNTIHVIDSNDISFTGVKVLKQDSSQHHLIGVEPTITVNRTIDAIKQGKDEYIEKALEVIKSN
jgi:C-terminal processing protease CtpA/Prc